MSVQLPVVETSDQPRVGPTRWGRFSPYLVLIAVVGVVVVLSTMTPDPVMEMPVPRPPALSESDGYELWGGFWAVEEMWLGPQLEFSLQDEYNKASSAWDRSNPTEESVIPQRSTRLLRISSQQTFEITSELYEGTNRNRTCRPRMTEMVYMTRFDPEGMGTVNALPIAWNEEKEDVLKKMDAGESIQGLYAFNGNTMQVYLPGDTKTVRPTAIPKTLSPLDRLFRLSRFSPGPRGQENGVRSYYPPTWAEIYDWKTKMYNSDGSIIRVTDDRHYAGPQFNRIPVPYSTPIEKFVDPAHTKNNFLIHHTNGWIVQTPPLPEPPPPPRILPDDAP